MEFTFQNVAILIIYNFSFLINCKILLADYTLDVQLTFFLIEN